MCTNAILSYIQPSYSQIATEIFFLGSQGLTLVINILGDVLGGIH